MDRRAVFFLLVLWGSLSHSFAQSVIQEGVGVPDSVVVGLSRSAVVERWGKSDSYLYTKVRKEPPTHPPNKRAAKSVIVKKVGRPKDIAFYQSLELFVYYTKSNTVHQVATTSSKYVTLRGLRVGDPRAKMQELYGPGNSPIVSYPAVGLDVVLECDIVKEIRVYASQ